MDWILGKTSEEYGLQEHPTSSEGILVLYIIHAVVEWDNQCTMF